MIFAIASWRSRMRSAAFLRGLERFVEIGLARMRQMRQRLLGRRVDHVLAPAAAAVHPLAVDIECEIAVHGVLVFFVIAEMSVATGLALFDAGFTPPRWMPPARPWQHRCRVTPDRCRR